MHLKWAKFSGVGPEGEPLVVVVEPGEKVKTASGLLPELQTFLDGLEPSDDFMYVLVNAMSYSEFFGSNSNADWYGYNPHLDYNGLVHAPPGWGKDLKRDHSLAKTWTHGFPCFYNAAVYGHHQNQGREKFGFGDVIYVANNTRMKRIELVLKVSVKEAHEKGRSNLLDRIRSGSRVDVSMGAKVPFDLASIETDWDEVKKAWRTFDPKRHAHEGMAVLEYHKKVKPIRGLSVGPKDRQESIRTMKNRILPDGRKVFVYNDFPRFFDISIVWIGADKSARVMWFMDNKAEDKAVAKPLITISRTELTIKTAMENKLGHSIKRSELIKRIPAVSAEVIQEKSFREPTMPLDMLSGLSAEFGPQTLLSTLGMLGIPLKPIEFQSAVGNPVLCVLAKRGTTFSTDHHKISPKYEVSPKKVNVELAKELDEWTTKRSSYGPFIHSRLADQSLEKVASASEAHGEVLDKLAAEYNGYRISLLEQSPRFAEQYLALGNASPDLMLKEASGLPSWAPLLLVAAPLIHLIAAHLRTQRDQHDVPLGPVANFVANNPYVVSMTTIGAGLRAAMEIAKRGGIVPAAKAVASTLLGGIS